MMHYPEPRRTRSVPPFVRWLLLAALALLISACSSATVTGPPPDPADVDGYVAALPRWTSFAPQEPDVEEPGETGDPFEEIVDGTEYSCVTTPYDLTRTPDEIVTYSPNASVLWLGALIQGRSYLEGLGSLQELPIRQRAPLTLRIDLLTGDNSETVENPSLSTVNAAIGRLIDRAMANGLVSGSDISYHEVVTHSTEQALLKLGLSARYYGSSARTRLETERNAAETTITAHFVQKMFTVAIELPQRPSDMFSDALTEALLQEQIAGGNLGPDNLPVYVANIAYGRILTYSMTSSYEEERMRAAIDFSYDGAVASGSAYSEAELRDTLSQAEIKVVALGGDDDNALSLIRSGDLKAYFETDSPLSSARPISYQLNNLDAANSLAKVSETTSYNLKECSAVPAEPVGERLRITLQSIKVHDACDSGLNGSDGEVFGSLSLNGSQVWSISRSNPRKTSDGETIAIGQYRDFSLYYAASDSVRVAGSIYDEDSTSANDAIGSWNFLISEYSAKGNRSAYSHPDCDSTLYYRIDRLGYLY